ncbi:MAG: MBL fold metallo-hydrolase [Candidatus Omnitrophica bacterium]|nr:MBL fold metallo-hydrolase [Candidatus Omnitrophota bacterium]
MRNICKLFCFILFIIFIAVCSNAYELENTGINIEPIDHASMVINTDNAVVYVDPVGKIEYYTTLAKPDIILITHSHYDHLAPELIKEIIDTDTIVIGPKEVIETLGYGDFLNNGDVGIYKGVEIEAVPAYNTSPDKLKFHEKGKGNGYVLKLNNKRIYISGDTEDIPEMRSLKNIYCAFVCMNLPYTMNVDQAASAVLEFKPAIIIPYHYKAQEMITDLDEFNNLVSADPNIKVVLLDWYAKVK